MFDFVRCTHNGTGGTGTITLAKLTGFPMPTDYAGASGTIRIPYILIEYADATKAVPVKIEKGRGLLVLSTLVFTRDEIGETVVDGTPATVNTSAPTALSFTNTAANFDFLISAVATSQRPTLPAMHTQSGILNEPYAPANTRMQIDSTSASLTLVAGPRYYIPTEYAFAKPITTIAVKAPSITVTGNVRIAVYEWGPDGLAGNLIKEFTSATQIAIATATGIKSLTLATPFWLPPGWYYFMIQADTAVQLLQGTPAGNCGIGSGNDRDGIYFTKSATYGAAPSPADASMSAATTRSSGGQPVIYIK